MKLWEEFWKYSGAAVRRSSQICHILGGMWGRRLLESGAKMVWENRFLEKFGTRSSAAFVVLCRVSSVPETVMEVGVQLGEWKAV